MSKSKGAQAAPKPALTAEPTTVEQKIDRAFVREMFEYIKKLAVLKPAMEQRIETAVSEGRITYGYAKSGNGTKGTDDPDKVGTVEHDEHDRSKLVGVVSGVKADVEPITLLGRFMHVLVAVGAFEYDPDNPRIYTKDGFATAARECGLEQMPYADTAKKLTAQAYGRYFKPGAWVLDRVKKHGNPPKAPFSIAGTKAASVKRSFNLKAYDPDHGPDAYGFFPVLNPAKSDGDAPVTAAACEAHAEKYGHLVFFNTQREDHKKALSFYRTEADVLAAATEQLTPEPDVEDEPAHQELAV